MKNNINKNRNGKINLITIFQTIGTFVILFSISLLIVLALTPGNFTDKLTSVGQYALRIIGIKQDEKIENNPLDSTFTDKKVAATNDRKTKN